MKQNQSTKAKSSSKKKTGMPSAPSKIDPSALALGAFVKLHSILDSNVIQKDVKTSTLIQEFGYILEELRQCLNTTMNVEPGTALAELLESPIETKNIVNAAKPQSYGSVAVIR